MKKVGFLFANGFEEAECLVPIDMMIRTREIEVVKIIVNDIADKAQKLSDNLYKVVGSHNIDVLCDTQNDGFLLNDSTDVDRLVGILDAVVAPGGLRGANNLTSSPAVEKLVKSMFAKGKIVAAICASPAAVLAKYGIISSTNKGICFPGCESMSGVKNVSDFLSEEFADKDGVCVSNNVISARSAACSFAFAFAIISKLCSVDIAENVKKSIYY